MKRQPKTYNSIPFRQEILPANIRCSISEGDVDPDVTPQLLEERQKRKAHFTRVYNKDREDDYLYINCGCTSCLKWRRHPETRRRLYGECGTYLRQFGRSRPLAVHEKLRKKKARIHQTSCKVPGCTACEKDDTMGQTHG